MEGPAHSPGAKRTSSMAVHLWGCPRPGFPSSQQAARMFQHSSGSMKAATKQWLTCTPPWVFILQMQQDGNPRQPQGAQHTEQRRAMCTAESHHVQRYGNCPSFHQAPPNTTCQAKSGPLRRPLGALRTCSLNVHHLFTDSHEKTV